MITIDKNTSLYCSFAKEAGSKGCAFHNAGFSGHGINAIYKSFSVDSIEDAILSVKTLGIKGFAVTMPFKKQVLKYVDEIDASANIGAANTIINTNNILKAYNTDLWAASDYLKKIDMSYDNFYILGNGGYALAVKSAADMLDMKYINITRETWSDLSKIRNSLVYNCTPVKDLEKIIDKSNRIINCSTETETGRQLANIQASYQFKLYTGKDYSI
tara:strand:+ start:2099 stop:2746 length:648 start_codon:yes stop_codon:yes gene_type:complete